MCIPFPIQLGMFTWPTLLKYPESMFKYTEAVAVVYLDDCKTFTTQTFTTPDVHHPQCKIRRSPAPV